MNNKIFALALILSAGMSLTATAGGINWQTDFSAATNAAIARNLPIFAYFSGSDWNKNCMRFDNIVLQKPEFQKFANSNFIMLQIDSPRKISLSPEIQKKNDELRKEKVISSYPTVLLLNSKGKTIATKNYDQGGVAAYIEELKKALGK